MNLKRITIHWLGLVLGISASSWKLTEAKQNGSIPNAKAKTEDGKAQIQVADAIGVFELTHVDCQPYTGSEQLISIDEDGVIECIRREDLPIDKNRSDANKSKRPPLGRLRSGTLLKGEVEPAPHFRSHLTDVSISKIKIQAVNLPGRPGIWLAMGGQENGQNIQWDEIYSRLGEGTGSEIQTFSRRTTA